MDESICFIKLHPFCFLSFFFFFLIKLIDTKEQFQFIYFSSRLTFTGLLLPRYQGTQAKSVNWVNERGGSKKLRGGG